MIMSEQNQNSRTVQQYKNQLQKIVDQKAGLAVSLLQLSAQERKIISMLPISARQIKHQAYQPFLHQECYLLLKLSNQGQSIWLSDNVQLAQMTSLNNFQVSIQNQVNQLHENLAKYESMIASLKELKEMQILEKEQEEYNKDEPSLQFKLKKYIQNLQKEIFQAKADIKKLNTEKMQLTTQLLSLKQKEKSSQQFRDLQNRFKQINDVALSQPPKRRQKKIMINF